VPRPDHLYRDVLAGLRQQFLASYAPGEKVPSQRELALMHGVGQATVHRALQALEKEGLVRARPRMNWERAPIPHGSQCADHTDDAGDGAEYSYRGSPACRRLCPWP
jgi:DNA-binding transcriptional MocR family regulator